MAVPASPAVAELEGYRRELTAHCYRMLGSGSEAEDAVQETMVRAWRHGGDLEAPGALRSWLYRIATNVCIDMSRQVQRRARPMDMGPSSPPDAAVGAMLPEVTWVTPIADDRITPTATDPADMAAHRESVRLAFVATLQHLPPRQRAALLLCDVLRYHATEAAEVLETTVAAVNSALQRARSTLASLPADPAATAPLDDADATLLERYVDAFERYDIPAFTALLREDAVQSMPPFAMWLKGAADIGRFMTEPGPSGCRGSRVLLTSANGCPAVAQYRPDPAGGYFPWGIHVLEISGGKVAAINTFLAFLDPDGLFARFGLPPHLDPVAPPP